MADAAVVNCLQDRHYMNHYRQHHSRSSDRCNSPPVAVMADSGRRPLTMKLVSCCKYPHPRTCRRSTDVAGVEYRLQRTSAEDVAEAEAGRVAAV